MKKTFSGLLIATFLVYVLYVRMHTEAVNPLPLPIINRTAAPSDNTPISSVPATTPVASSTPPANQTTTDNTLVAQGTVRVVNNSTSSIKLVKTTRLLAPNGKLYRLASDVNVPAGQEATAIAYADQNGSSYAISATRFTIPGLSAGMQSSIYAISDAAFALTAPNASSDQPVAAAPPTSNLKPVAVTPTPVTPPPAPKPQGQYKDGTYTGNSVDAYYGNVQVAAVIQSGKLADVKILDYPQDRRTSQAINGQALPILVSEAIQAQSASVDAVSGASESSPAFMQSLASALSQAKN